MERLGVMLIAAALIAGCGNDSQDRYEADLERVVQNNQNCLDRASTLAELDVCDAQLDRDVNNMLGKLESGYYDR